MQIRQKFSEHVFLVSSSFLGFLGSEKMIHTIIMIQIRVTIIITIIIVILFLKKRFVKRKVKVKN